MSHLRLVVAVSRNYMGYGLPQADLIQEGNVGLMKAVRRFDPERGVRLVSFALHWIRAEIHEYILRNWRLVKVATTKAQRKLFFNLRSMKGSTAALTHAQADDIAKALNVKPEEVLEMETRLSGRTSRSTRPRATRSRSRPIACLTDDEDEPAQILEREETARNRSVGLQARAGQARRSQPPHHRSALAEGGRSGDAAGARRRVRRVRRAHPADRKQGDQDDAARWRWRRRCSLTSLRRVALPPRRFFSSF